MADHHEHEHEHEETKGESLLEKISEKIHDHHSSSSSSSDSDNEKPSSSPTINSKIFRIFGREKPVHKVFGGGKRMWFLFAQSLVLSFVFLFFALKFLLNYNYFWLLLCVDELSYPSLLVYGSWNFYLHRQWSDRVWFVLELGFLVHRYLDLKIGSSVDPREKKLDPQ